VRTKLPQPSTTDPATVNGGSPVGPGFVVPERAPGRFGYDLKMAKSSIGPRWQHLVECFFQTLAGQGALHVRG
jgi:hypothetical protein